MVRCEDSNRENYRYTDCTNTAAIVVHIVWNLPGDAGIPVKRNCCAKHAQILLDHVSDLWIATTSSSKADTYCTMYTYARISAAELEENEHDWHTGHEADARANDQWERINDLREDRGDY